MCFITGTYVRTNYLASALLLEQWDRCNDMVLNWILGSLSQEVYLGHVFSNNAASVWNELKDTYDRIDGSIVFNLLQKTNSFKQGGLPVFEYYHKLNSLWREYEILTKLPDCTYSARLEVANYDKMLKLMQFLMGLDDIYQPIRSSILTREVLPEAKDAFLIISREESYRGIPSSSGTVKTEKAQASAFVSKQSDMNRSRNNNWSSNGNNVNRGVYVNLLCKNCGFKGHTNDRCFELIGYPPGFKRNPNLKPNTNGNSKSDSGNFRKGSSNNSETKTSGNVSFTNEQVMKLMSLLNDMGSAGQSNMACITKCSFFNCNVFFNQNFYKFFCANVTINGINYHMGWIIDSGANQHMTNSIKDMVNLVDVFDLKLTVGHSNGTLAKITHVGNLKLNNDVMLFDVLVIPEYNVSLLSVHKLIKDSPCEVCHKAKQTKDSFSLSENKSTVFGQLMHLDVWGSYKVISREGFRYFLTILDDYSRLPSSVLNGKSHFSLVYNKEPNLSYLRSFGCLCYAALIKGSDKFSEKSEKCVLISYASDKKAYKLFSLENRNVLYSRDVKFYETIFPYRMSVQLDVEQNKTESEVTNLNFFDCVESDPKPKASISPNDDEVGSSCRDGSVHQSGPSHSLDQPKVDEHIPTSGSGSDLQGSGNDGLVTATPIDENTKPSSFEEASKDPNWISAMNNEMNALYENDTWYLVDLPFGRKPIGSKWVFKIKYKSDGEVDSFKARVVAKGFGQKEGLDYEETFSLVVKIGTVRCLLSLAVQNEWDIYQMDINNAFLYVDLIEDVYMLPPPGFFDPSDKRVCTSKVEIAKFKHFLSNRFKIKDLGELKCFLGIEVLKVSGGLCLSQRKYCLELLHDFGLLACRPVLTPLPENIILAHKETEKDKFLVKITSYQRSVSGYCVFVNGCLIFWKSKKQVTLSKSSAEAEYRSIAAATYEIMWIVKIMSDLNIKNLLPAELYCDNKAAMQIAANPVMHEKTKHFDLDVHFIREKVCSGLIKTAKVESKDNVADILTKALASFQHVGSNYKHKNKQFFVTFLSQKLTTYQSDYTCKMDVDNLYRMA
nr:ribonuclease H-like domain-containing protein [Tanacetum cinerariifolium]